MSQQKLQIIIFGQRMASLNQFPFFCSSIQRAPSGFELFARVKPNVFSERLSALEETPTARIAFMATGNKFLGRIRFLQSFDVRKEIFPEMRTQRAKVSNPQLGGQTHRRGMRQASKLRIVTNASLAEIVVVELQMD
ncbi:hypothetical protein CEXT_706541 [Caerostris extrusa]|uniref:Uncharacterized protein n=1 Tax=Caerostris extrusa TaxID=172846 RepID=A0AAV4XST7_CAEEX|nr:hypothetical protein CEXT_706541 [Caerostris extrusa]